MAVPARRPFNPPTTPGAEPKVRVPRVVTEPVWSLQPWPVDVSLAGQQYQIPAAPAASWLGVLMTDAFVLDDLFLALAPELGDAVDEALYGERFSFDDYADLVLDIISNVSGRPWHIALRLIGSARNSWNVVGAELILKGVDATQISLSAWLDVVLLVMIRGMEAKDVAMFTAKLEAPPPGADPVDEMTMSTDDFGALMAGQ